MYYLLKCFLSQLNTSKQTNICEYGTHIHIHILTYLHRLTGRQILQISTSYVIVIDILFFVSIYRNWNFAKLVSLAKTAMKFDATETETHEDT